MASNSPSSVSDTIRELARRNNERDQPPVAIGPVSPFHEVLVRDVAASLPPELRNRVEAASTVSGVNDWIAAVLLRALYLYRVLYLNFTVPAAGGTAAAKVLAIVVSLFLVATMPILVLSINRLWSLRD